MTEEVEQEFSLAARRAEMNVGEEKGAVLLPVLRAGAEQSFVEPAAPRPCAGCFLAGLFCGSDGFAVCHARLVEQGGIEQCHVLVDLLPRPY